jgi:cobalt-precorrin-5B (C1)-methyltransferase
LLDLHSGRGVVDLGFLAAQCTQAGVSAEVIARIKQARSAGEILAVASTEGLDIAAAVAEAAWRTAAKVLQGSAIALEVAVFDRTGNLLAQTPFRPAH